MPPKKNISAPANRVYKSAAPLRQAKFPEQNKRVKITYGKTRFPKQDTLTQMDFIRLQQVQDEQEGGEEKERKNIREGGDLHQQPKMKRRRTGLEDEDEAGSGIEQCGSRVTRSSRRKTMGDDEEELIQVEPGKATRKRRRKTMGDTPSTTRKYHTQTITQIDYLSSFNSGDSETEGLDLPEMPEDIAEEEQVGVQIGETLPKGIYDMPSSSQQTTDLRKSTTAPEVLSPQTPRRTLPREIPSSQSPLTPLSARLRGSAMRRSPLKEQSINAPIPYSTSKKGQASPEKRIKLEIEDTFDTASDSSQMMRTHSTPAKRSSAKSVRFAVPDALDRETTDEDEDGPPDSPSTERKGTHSLSRHVLDRVQFHVPVASQLVPHPKQPRAAVAESVIEIQDSEDEDDDDYDDPESQIRVPESVRDGGSPEDTGQAGSMIIEEFGETLSPVFVKQSQENIIPGEDEQAERQDAISEEPETWYGEIGLETQFEADQIFSRSTSQTEESPPESFKRPMLLSKSQNIPTKFNDSSSFTSSEINVVEEKTQIMESQRMATQHVKAMAPRTHDSDIFISIHPQHMTNIINRTKDHEIRPYRFPPGVRRVWIYETSPVKTLKYMAEISSAKSPGQIVNERGIGNAGFNARLDSSRTAYEILQLYELADPITLSELLSREWLKKAPQRFDPVRPAVLDELMSNLKPPLFDHEPDAPFSSSSDTQEAEEQLISNIKQFTQAQHPVRLPQSSSSQMVITNTDSREEPPSSPPQTTALTRSQDLPRAVASSQATAVDLSQPASQTPRHERSLDIVHESPLRPVRSSSSSELPQLRSDTEDLGSNTLVPFSLGSSQLLTRSQLVAERMLSGGESAPGPPMSMQDDDEDDEL